MSTAKNILVTGAGGSAGHNVCWSLRTAPGGRDLRIIGADSERTSLELNAWVDRAYHIPRADDPGYLEALNKVLRREKVGVIFPQPDPEIKRISRDRGKLNARLFLPDAATVSVCLDKLAALDRWHGAGLRLKPVLLSLAGHAKDRNLRKLSFPRWIRAREGAGGFLSCLARDRETADLWIRFHWAQGFKGDFLAEEHLPGKDYCFTSLWNKGALVTSMARERLTWVGRRLIGSGGTSKLNQVVHSRKVNDAALKAIRAVSEQPHGVLCVDLKEDSEGVPRPTEINCRFTTNVQYLTLASVRLGRPDWNFPWLAARIALGEAFPACRKLDALPDNLSFTKNTDMGLALVKDGRWKAAEIRPRTDKPRQERSRTPCGTA